MARKESNTVVKEFINNMKTKLKMVLIIMKNTHVLIFIALAKALRV